MATMQRLVISLFTPLALGVTVWAQCNPMPPVVTTTVAGNGQKGTMFDIVNTTAGSVTIQSFEQCFLAAGTSAFEIYTKVGTWSGSENTAGAWTLVGSNPAVVHGVAPVLDPLGIPVNVTIPAGGTQAFYLTVTNATATNVAYTTGVNQINTVIGTDGLLEVRAGPGKAYPFAGSLGLPTAGRLWNGRVTYCINGTPATNTSLGVGCIRLYTSFYELFATPATFDLSNSAITLTPNAGGYTVTSGGSFLPVGSVQTPPTALALGDDTAVQVPFTVGTFAGPAGAWTGVNVTSNGIVSQAAGNTLIAAPSPATMLAAPQTAFWSQADFDPVGGTGTGTIWFEESAAVSTITWDGVASWNVPGSLNTFQFQLYPNGVVVMAWGAMNTNATGANGGVLVGYSPAGASLDPGSVDLSALGSIVTTATDQPPITVTGSTRPVTGSNWNLAVTNIPAGAALGIDIFGLSDPGLNDLGFLGMPGCGLRANLDVLNAYLPAGSTHNYSLVVPANPVLIGFQVYTTSAMFVNPPPNAFGAVTANGLRGVVGDV
jgi:hypothetical protein